MAVQTLAFSALYDIIPTLQEDVSIEIVLDDKTARLPSDLLSMIYKPPVSGVKLLTDMNDDDILYVVGYIRSWILLFRHFQNAVRQPTFVIC